tara:strand:- start:7639 stop:7824 length:186 start_codon:yes stop_codon:yes gene_type:complete
MEFKITPAINTELKFLRTLVDRLEKENYKLNDNVNVARDLFNARKELKEFTYNLRKQGYQI